MQLKVLNECGYEEATLGFSLSWNSTPERAKELLPLWAFKQGGENKFLESMVIWIDVTAPRYWWQEADTYRVGISKQSQSTIHTLAKKPLDNTFFQRRVPLSLLNRLNFLINNYKYSDGKQKKDYFLELKSLLPEGFLQRRIVCLNYKALQNIYAQRVNHRLPEWSYFCEEILKQIEHPEFIVWGDSVKKRNTLEQL